MLESFALNAERELHGTIVVFASYGTMIQTKIYIIAMIVAYVEKAVASERISSIARLVISLECSILNCANY